MRVLSRIVWIVSLLAILGMTFLFITQPPSMPKLDPMTAYVSADKSLALQYPGNWKPHEASSHAVAGSLFFDPNANTHFAVDTSLAGSLMGDVVKSSNASLGSLPGMPPEVADKLKSPLETMHESSLKTMAKSKTRYSEFEQGATQKIRVGDQEALSTDFTFKRGAVWGKKEMFGTYVTVLAPDREVRVTATCSKELQQTMKPIFEQMIASMRLGPTGG